MSTNIAWSEETWNPVTGCSKVSKGCANCYAAAWAPRLAAQGIEGYTQLPWTYPNAAANVHLHYDRLGKPLGWRRPRFVFVNSMSDLFHQQIPGEFLDRVFAVMALRPQHTFQILTKRPRTMADYMASPRRPGLVDQAAFETARDELGGDPDARNWSTISWPPSNVWLGTSIEDQRAAEERVPHLLAAPATVRFLSCEPLLGPVDLTRVSYTCAYSGEAMHFNALSANVDEGLYFENHDDGYLEDAAHPLCPRVDWVIVGGESGPKYRTLDPDWARSLRDQAAASGVAFFYKQSSGTRPGNAPTLDGRHHGEFPAQAPEAGRENPQAGDAATPRTPEMFEEENP